MECSVCFRALEPEDAELIYLWHNDTDMMKNAVGLSRFWSKQECIDWVKDKSKKDPFNYWFAICLNDDSKKMIGYFGINNIHFINSSVTCNALVIGDKANRDGISWIETYLFMYEFVFEKLHLNRFYGVHIEGHPHTSLIPELFFSTREGRLREGFYSGNKYVDGICTALLAKDYFEHKNKGEYELKNIIKRLRKIIRTRISDK